MRGGPHLRAFGRILNGIQAAGKQQVRPPCPAPGPLPVCMCTMHVRVLTRDASPAAASQFHNDFMGPPYGKAYNSIQGQLYKSKVIATTGCPDMDPSRVDI